MLYCTLRVLGETYIFTQNGYILHPNLQCKRTAASRCTQVSPLNKRSFNAAKLAPSNEIAKYSDCKISIYVKVFYRMLALNDLQCMYVFIASHILHYKQLLMSLLESSLLNERLLSSKNFCHHFASLFSSIQTALLIVKLIENESELKVSRRKKIETIQINMATTRPFYLHNIRKQLKYASFFHF